METCYYVVYYIVCRFVCFFHPGARSSVPVRGCLPISLLLWLSSASLKYFTARRCRTSASIIYLIKSCEAICLFLLDRAVLPFCPRPPVVRFLVVVPAHKHSSVAEKQAQLGGHRIIIRHSKKLISC